MTVCYVNFIDYHTLRVGGLVFAGVIVVLSFLLLAGKLSAMRVGEQDDLCANPFPETDDLLISLNLCLSDKSRRSCLCRYHDACNTHNELGQRHNAYKTTQ